MVAGSTKPADSQAVLKPAMGKSTVHPAPCLLPSFQVLPTQKRKRDCRKTGIRQIQSEQFLYGQGQGTHNLTVEDCCWYPPVYRPKPASSPAPPAATNTSRKRSGSNSRPAGTNISRASHIGSFGSESNRNPARKKISRPITRTGQPGSDSGRSPTRAASQKEPQCSEYHLPLPHQPLHSFTYLLTGTAVAGGMGLARRFAQHLHHLQGQVVHVFP